MNDKLAFSILLFCLFVHLSTRETIKDYYNITDEEFDSIFIRGCLYD